MKKGRRLAEIEAEMEEEQRLLDEYLAEVEKEEEMQEMDYYSHLGEVPWGVQT